MRKCAVVAVSALTGFVVAVAIFGSFQLPPARAGNEATQNGDTNGDGSLDIADVIYTLMYLFRGGPAPTACAESTDLEARVTQLEAKIAAIRGLTPEEAEILGHFSLRDESAGTYTCNVDQETDEVICSPPFLARTIRIEGANLQLVNGTGSTGEINGLGNLIIGYQEQRCCESEDPCCDQEKNHRGGSHNLIVGERHNYKTHSCAVIGSFNSAWGPAACVAGGAGNIAGGERSFVGGGWLNTALAERSAIVGGRRNIVGTGEVDQALVGSVDVQTTGGCCPGP